MPGKIASFIMSAMLYESYSPAMAWGDEVASPNALQIRAPSHGNIQAASHHSDYSLESANALGPSTFASRNPGRFTVSLWYW